MNLITPTFSGVMTALLLVLFVGIWIWSWSAKRKPDFERMANLPLEEDFKETVTEAKESTDKKDEGAL